MSSINKVASILQDQLTSISNKARQSGDLISFPSRLYTVEDSSVQFQVRMLEKHRAKHSFKSLKGTSNSNPFLPYEQPLYIQHLDSGHIILLNKYSLVENHFLIITPEFEPQESALSEQEFLAIGEVLTDMPLLVFYNSGKRAGASQPHKHIQALPLMALPIDQVITQIPDTPTPLHSLKYQHLMNRLPYLNQPDFPKQCFSMYQTMLSELGLINQQGEVAPYNLLITRQWMVVIPRNEGRPEGIPLNALGYAGLLLVKTDEQLMLLRKQGVFNLLSAAN